MSNKINKINVGGVEYTLPSGSTAHVEGSALYINNSGSGSSSGGTGSGGGSSGEGASANVFEDVVKLPESPDSSKIYRVITPKLYGHDNFGLHDFAATVKLQLGMDIEYILVDKLPDNPINIDEYGKFVLYILGNEVYLYGTGPSGNVEWFTFNLILQAYGFEFGGVLTDITNVNWQEGYVYVYLGDNTYSNNNNTFQINPHLVYTSEITLEHTTSNITLGISFDLLKNYKHIDIEIITITNLSDGSGSVREANIYNQISRVAADVLDSNGTVLSPAVCEYSYVFDTYRIMSLQLTPSSVELWLKKITTSAGSEFYNFDAGTYTIKLYAK